MRRALTTIAGFLVLPGAALTAGDFRIESKVYVVNGDEAPISENLTLFQSGVAYDFLTEPETVTIFRPRTETTPGRFVVLDPARNIKMEVTTDQIERLLEKLRDWAKNQDDPYVRFQGEPVFTQASLPDEDGVVLTSKHMTYRIHAKKMTDDASLAAYRQFSDWYARFNTRGGVLPFPRLAVNETLFRERLIPTQVELSARGVELRAEHRTNWLLSKQDRQLIEEAQRQLSDFREVTPDEFVKRAQGQLQ